MVSEWGILWPEDKMFPLSRINAIIYSFYSLPLSMREEVIDPNLSSWNKISATVQ